MYNYTHIHHQLKTTAGYNSEVIIFTYAYGSGHTHVRKLNVIPFYKVQVYMHLLNIHICTHVRMCIISALHTHVMQYIRYISSTI